MDREYLFRGYTTETATSGPRWVFGDLVHNRESRVGIRYLDSSLAIVGKELFYTSNVVPESVGLSTGDSAVSGTRGMNDVFEGDILKYTLFDCYDKDTQFVGVVKFVRGEFVLEGRSMRGTVETSSLSWVLDQDCTAEIVGNTIDNPELMPGVVK